MDLQELQRIKNKFDIIGNDAALTRKFDTLKSEKVKNI